MARTKKVKEESFQVKSVQTPVLSEPTIVDTYQIVVENPKKDFPNPIEIIKTTQHVPGGILWTANAFEGNPSFLDEKVNKVALCKAIIAELDKGDKGFFNNDYFVDCDSVTPHLKQLEFFKTQFLRIWKKPEPPTQDELKLHFAGQMRLYLRAIAFRFFTYYQLGYLIKFVKLENKGTETQEITPLVKAEVTEESVSE